MKHLAGHTFRLHPDGTCACMCTSFESGKNGCGHVRRTRSAHAQQNLYGTITDESLGVKDIGAVNGEQVDKNADGTYTFHYNVKVTSITLSSLSLFLSLFLFLPLPIPLPQSFLYLFCVHTLVFGIIFDKTKRPHKIMFCSSSLLP